MLWTFRSLQRMFVDNRPFTEPAHAVIAATPALQERQLAKTASTTAVAATALQRRGLNPNLATLAAETGMAMFGHAARSWIENPSIDLGTNLEQAFAALRGLAVPPPR